MHDNVNLVFGRNLRQLCEVRGTFAEAARILDVSRVQLNRYFKGESFPKPNQLARICDLFGVDARIYTQPMADLQSVPGRPCDYETQTTPRLAPGIDDYLTAEHPVPDGVHLVYRPSFTLPGRYVVSPLLVRRTNRGTMLRGMDMPPTGKSRSHNGGVRGRSYRGLAFATPDGVVMHFYGTGSLPFLATAHFVSRSFFAATGTFRGSYEIYRPPQPNEVRRVPILLNVLEQRPAVVLPAARASGIVDLHDIPEPFRDYLSSALAA